MHLLFLDEIKYNVAEAASEGVDDLERHGSWQVTRQCGAILDRCTTFLSVYSCIFSLYQLAEQPFPHFSSYVSVLYAAAMFRSGSAAKKRKAKLPSLPQLTLIKSPTNKAYLQSFSRVVGKRGEPLVWYKKNGNPWWAGMLCSPDDPFLNPPLPEELKAHRPGRVLVRQKLGVLYSFLCCFFMLYSSLPRVLSCQHLYIVVHHT